MYDPNCPCCVAGCPPRKKNRKLTRKEKLGIASFYVGAAVLVAVVELVPPIRDFFHTYILIRQTLVAASLLLVAMLLYLIRETAKPVYGAIELILGFLYGYHSLTRLSEVGPIEILSVVAAVYFAVRGMDNLFVGIQHAGENRRKYEAYLKRKEDDAALFEVMPYYHPEPAHQAGAIPSVAHHADEIGTSAIPVSLPTP